MCSLSKSEIDKLSILYEGDKNRDASSKIRGFLFQDYVTLSYILQEKVEYVCSEYIEDVDVFYENGDFKFIQVKYYSSKTPNSKEIFTDLYYHYLRLEMLHSTLKALPCIVIHGKSGRLNSLSMGDMKKYIGKDDLPHNNIIADRQDEAIEYLRNNIYNKAGKDTQKENLFIQKASEESIENFIRHLSIDCKPCISEYQDELMNKLGKEFSKHSYYCKEENWKIILFGLAISYIQRRYTSADIDFCKIRICKKEFYEYMSKSIQSNSESSIVSYLVGIATSEYEDIINNNDLSSLQIHILNSIYQNTVTWLEAIASTVKGQYKLLNTFSIDDAKEISKYEELALEDRLLKICESKAPYIKFLCYMWKIILNIAQKKIEDEEHIKSNMDLFKPDKYMNNSVEEYVCFDFPDDKYIKRSIILPGAYGTFRKVKRKIVDRMIKTTNKPEKWFFENSVSNNGKNYYNYSTADVKENTTVVDLEDDVFFIECMECIGIDEQEWNIKEECSNCIFSDKCIKES